MNEVKASDYPNVYAWLGIETGRLGCVMVDTDALVNSDIIKEADYYTSDDPEHKWVAGNVSETVPHVTVLYGLMRSGQELRTHILAILEGWELPDLTVQEVSFFYGHNSEYVTIIALVKVSDELKEGHQRLSLLPHINTFGEYKPHITLAYVKMSAPFEDYVKQLNSKFAHTTIGVKGINLGD